MARKHNPDQVDMDNFHFDDGEDEKSDEELLDEWSTEGLDEDESKEAAPDADKDLDDKDAAAPDEDEDDEDDEGDEDDWDEDEEDDEDDEA